MALSDNTRGAVFMMGSMTAFTLNDACMKSLSGEIPLFQALVLRSLAVIVFLGFMAWRGGAFRTRIAPRDQFLIGLRTAVEIGAAFFFISALFHLPIADVTAILQALPLTVTLAGALFLGEAVGWKRLTAILVGFVGVLLILQPPFLFGEGSGFSIYSIYVLLAVACVTVRDLCARRISAAVPSMTIALAAAVGVASLGAVGSVTQAWQPVSTMSALWLAGASFFVIGGYIFSVSAMRSGEISFVAPFRYTSLVAALLLGLILFGDWPDALTLLGSGIVVATGLFTLYRERATARKVHTGLRPR
ncbi:DMT family transporter [Litoreibacter janthinus]|uniref:S-adenosylmethionine uptake transporter n=1 Tax=Litoreibacter janthinus TaxID=670154 RepID=A0A1I6IFB8_9RHOB|nr:DMT family transporter [Litoreibacter janthinus]SFR65477.1 S-adenosylmethionine uptake transporter [Litoreibacter janthinus]